MSRRIALLLLLAVATLASGQEQCGGVNPVTPVPPRSFRVELHAAHAGQQNARSAPGVPSVATWSGRAEDQVDVQLVPPASMSGVVRDSALQSVGDACVFFDAGGQLGDVASVTDSSGLMSRLIVPATYDLVVAPDCLTGTGAAVVLEDQQLPVEGGGSEWTLPQPAVFNGRVQTTGGIGIAGAVVSFYDAERPEQHLGVTVVPQDAPEDQPLDKGRFSALVPAEGRFDIVISAPGDGGVPLPPIRLVAEEVPDPGLSLVVRYPPIQTSTLRGVVQLPPPSETSYANAETRVLVEGWVAAPLAPDSDFDGGYFRAEVPLDVGGGGTFSLEVPEGSYRVAAIPAFEDLGRYDVGAVEIDVPGGVGDIDVEVPLADGVFTRIEVVDGNNPISGARVELQMLTWPYFAFGNEAFLEDLGGFLGFLPRGNYRVEVTPPIDEETGAKRWARTSGTFEVGRGEASVVQLFLRRSDQFEGFVFTGQTQGAGGVRVLMFDPADGALLDETITNSETSAGFFRGILPRP